jgi:oligopeptide transport system substrate-binding protein
MTLKIKFATLALSLSFLSACTQKQAPTDELRMRLNTEPPSFDVNLMADNVSAVIGNATNDGLLALDKDLKTIPMLAESWTISPDGKTYTFKLREGLKWSDGQPLLAQHFVDSWERLLNAKTGSEYAYFLFDLENAQAYNSGKVTDFSKVGASAPDDRTVVAKLDKAAAYWINIPTHTSTFPVRKDVIAQWGDKWTEPAHIVSSGPYKIVETQKDSKIVLEKNLNSFRTSPDQIKRIVFRIVKDNTTAVSVFKNGDVDIVRDLPPLMVKSLEQSPEFVSAPFLRGYYFGFNVTDPNVSNPKVRKALALAIDRGQLKQLFGSMITPSQSWNQPGFAGHDEANGLAFNPEEAKKLWAQVNPKPAKLEYWFQTDELGRMVAENLKAQWKTVLGVDVELQNQEWKVYLKTLKNKAPAMWRMGWGADYPDPDNFMNLFTCTSGNNFSKFCSKAYDAKIFKAAASQKPEERAQLYGEIERELLQDNVAIVPLFNQTNMFLVSKRVKGFAPDPLGFWDFASIRLENAAK